MPKTKRRTYKRRSNKRRTNGTKKMRGGFPWQLMLTTLVMAVASVQAMPGYTPISVVGSKIYMDDNYYNKLSPDIQSIMTESENLGRGKHVLNIGSDCQSIISKLENIKATFSSNNNVKLVVDDAINNAMCGNNNTGTNTSNSPRGPLTAPGSNFW